MKTRGRLTSVVEFCCSYDPPHHVLSPGRPQHRLWLNSPVEVPLPAPLQVPPDQVKGAGTLGGTQSVRPGVRQAHDDLLRGTHHMEVDEPTVCKRKVVFEGTLLSIHFHVSEEESEGNSISQLRGSDILAEAFVSSAGFVGVSWCIYGAPV